MQRRTRPTTPVVRLVLATVVGVSCREPTQVRLALSSSSCELVTSVHVHVDGATTEGVDERVGPDASVRCGPGGELGSVVVVPGPSGASKPVTVRIQASILGGSCDRGSRVRCVEAARTIRFSGSAELPIALEAECADVECMPTASGREQSCRVVTVGGERVPVCAPTDCASGSCDDGGAGDAGMGDGGAQVDAGPAPVCASPLLQPAGTQLARWDFEVNPLVPSVGMAPPVDIGFKTKCYLWPRAANTGLAECGKYVACSIDSPGFRLGGAAAPSGRLAVGFYLRTKALDVTLLRFGANLGGGELRVAPSGTLQWRLLGTGNIDYTSTVPVATNRWERVEVHIDAVAGTFEVWSGANEYSMTSVPMPGFTAQTLDVLALASDLDALDIRELP